MGLFGRRAKGRHALGAAVTSIPSGPLPPVASPPSVATPVAPAAPVTLAAPVAPAAPVEALAAASAPPAVMEQNLTSGEVEDLVAHAPLVAPALLSEISALLATGEAWAENDVAGAAPVAAPPADVSSAGPAAAPHQDPVSAGPAHPVGRDVAPATGAPSVPVVVPIPIPVPTPAAATPDGRSALEAAVAELLPQPARSVEVAPQVVPAAAVPTSLRVQLGFRDGTSTSLDPASDQSQALQELARTLTSRD